MTEIGTFYARGENPNGKFEVVMFDSMRVSPAKAALAAAAIEFGEGILGDFSIITRSAEDWAAIGKIIQGEIVVVERADHVRLPNPANT
jgi:hypothetical protein